MTKFTDLGLAEPILKALEGEGYDTPTPIQAQAIPVALAGRDILGIAQTGTGKTAAFALPILHRLATDRRPPQRKGCRVLVLSPTRELASQIADSFQTYGRHVGVSVAVVLGGVGHRPQAQRLARGVDVLVATPGRLLDHVSEGNVMLAGTEVFVLDEADQMLDLGFFPSIRRIVSRLTDKRQSLFFSATMPGEIGKLADDLLRDPAKVAVTPVSTPVERIAQRVIHVDRERKLSVLVDLLGDQQMSRALVFTRTKRGADRVSRHLDGAGISVAAIHGDKSQPQRRHALADFRDAKVRVLVATDIAARGIDIDGVTHVVNYELPDVPEAYVHRIGRTARAGAEGIAISLCGGDERVQLRDIERLTRQSIPAEDRRRQGAEDASAEALMQDRPSAARNRGAHQHGKSRHGKPAEGTSRNGKPWESKPRNDKPRGSGKPWESKSRDDKPRGSGKPWENRSRDDKPRSNGKPWENRSRDDKPRDGKPWENRSRDDKPRDGKPWENRSRDDKPRDGKPWENRSRDDKPRDGKSWEGKSRDDKPRSNGKPWEGKSRDDKSRDGKPRGASQGRPPAAHARPNRSQPAQRRDQDARGDKGRRAGSF